MGQTCLFLVMRPWEMIWSLQALAYRSTKQRLCQPHQKVVTNVQPTTQITFTKCPFPFFLQIHGQRASSLPFLSLLHTKEVKKHGRYCIQMSVILESKPSNAKKHKIQNIQCFPPLCPKGSESEPKFNQPSYPVGISMAIAEKGFSRKLPQRMPGRQHGTDWEKK